MIVLRSLRFNLKKIKKNLNERKRKFKNTLTEELLE